MMTKPASSYNEIPYPTVPRWRTHPSHLAVLTRLLGLDPTPVEGSRVLELGCGNGKNLIPMAYQLPKSEFIGLDLSTTQVAQGQSWITTLGLTNISLKAQDILDIEAGSWGQFDYIIVYGVYSWVTPEVQTKILDICKQLLSPQGIAYITYNTYPGWAMHGLIRGMMLYYTRQLDEPYSRAKQAREVLNFFAETLPTLSPSLSGPLQINSLILQNLRDLLKDQPDEYLLHDHLETSNNPLYFYQFVEQAEQHGLQYVADAESSPLIGNYLPSQFIRSIEGLAKSPVEFEQLIDFLYMRSFRQTLLCHQGLPLNRQPGPEQLKSLNIVSSAKPAAEFDLHSTEEVRFRSAIGASVTTAQPLNKAAMLHLAEIWPQGISFDRLLTIARSRLNPTAPLVYNTASLARETETLGSFLLKGYALNLIELRAYAPHFTLEINEHPVASALARLQAQEGRQVTNQCHEIVTLDNEISHYLLPYLDGHLNRTQLLEKLMALVKAGTLVVQVEDQTAAESEPVRQILAEALEQTLRYLAQNALLVG